MEWAYKTCVDHPGGGQVLLGPFLVKITNEGKRSWNLGKKMKKEGLLKGASDLFLAFPILINNEYGDTEKDLSGFWYEVKAPRKKPTKDQLSFLVAMQDIGYGVGWGDSVDKGIKAFKDYLGMR